MLVNSVSVSTGGEGHAGGAALRERLGVRYRSIPRSEKLPDARHRRFHPQCQDDSGSSVTGQAFELDTAVQIDPFGWTLQRPRQRLQNRDDGARRAGLRAARI